MRGRLALLLAVAVLSAGCSLFERPQPARPYHEEVLAAAPFTTLVVEVDHAPGRRPSEAALAHLVSTLRNVTSKQEVTLRVQETLRDDPAARWTPEAIRSLEEGSRSAAHEAPTALLHVLYPAGLYHQEGVAGVTVTGPRPPPVVVFLDALREAQTDLGPLPLLPGAVERLERATLLHEAGHAMGLVGAALPQVRDREDPEHEGHSRNPRSVMYWQVETVQGLRDMLLQDGSVPDTFDADDRADLRSAGGR